MDIFSSDEEGISFTEARKAVYFLQKRKGYRYVQHISKGGYGIVVSMYDDTNQIPIAVKCTDDPSRVELETWKSFRHPSVVPLLEMFMLDCCVVFVMPLYRKDMWSMCGEKFFYHDPLTYDLCRVWFKDVLRGLTYLHARSYAHLDLKLDNIFLKDNGHACIGDFSLTARIDRVTKYDPFLEHFQPPEFTPYYEEITGEVLDDRLLRGDAADVWELGIFVVDMLTDRKVAIEKNSCYEMWKFDVYPYLEKLTGNIKYLKYTLEHRFTGRKFSLEDISMCHNFILQTLQISPSERASAVVALTHPFVDVTWPRLPRPIDGSPLPLQIDDGLDNQIGGVGVEPYRSQEAIRRLRLSMENLFLDEGAAFSGEHKPGVSGIPGTERPSSADGTSSEKPKSGSTGAKKKKVKKKKKKKSKKAAKIPQEHAAPGFPAAAGKHKQGAAAADVRLPKKDDPGRKK